MRTALLALSLLAGVPAWAQSVALQGMMGNKALLVIDGTASRAAAIRFIGINPGSC